MRRRKSRVVCGTREVAGICTGAVRPHLYPAECGLQLGFERSLKKWEVQIPCFQQLHLGSNTLVLVNTGLPHALGYACTLYASHYPSPHSTIGQAYFVRITTCGLGWSFAIGKVPAFKAMGALSLSQACPDLPFLEVMFVGGRQYFGHTCAIKPFGNKH